MKTIFTLLILISSSFSYAERPQDRVPEIKVTLSCTNPKVLKYSVDNNDVSAESIGNEGYTGSVANGNLTFTNKTGTLVLGPVTPSPGTACTDGTMVDDVAVLPGFRFWTETYVTSPCVQLTERSWQRMKLSVTSLFAAGSKIPQIVFSYNYPFTYSNPACQTGSGNP